jgi:UDP-2,3-diacylglucosamine pyrophosphatase LpxH
MKKHTIFIRTAISALFFVLLSASKSPAQPDTLSFLHISDLHVIFNLDIYQQDLAQSREHYGHGVKPFKKFLKTMPQKTNSNMIIVSGDLIDFYEGEIKNGKMMDFQAEQFTRLLKNSNIPVFLTLGNHDIAAYSWKDKSRVSTQYHAEKARATWIRNTPCFKNGTYYNKIIKAGNQTFRLIFLDDAYNSVLPGENMEIPYIDKAQVHWLQKQIEQSNDDIEIILMHIPLKNEEGKDVPDCELFSVLKKYSSIKLVLAGHNHKNAITPFNIEDGHKIIQVQTGAFARSTENWRLIRLTGDNIFISVPGKTENELTIPIK